MKTVKLNNGDLVPILGQGTWYMGEGRQPLHEEANALRAGIDLGMTLIDTAEMYGNGGAEKVVGQAVKDIRDKVFIVSKILPSHASQKGTITACERSLQNLNTDRIDLYLLHWRGSYPLEETVCAFEKLIEQGKIKSWGVSNFDTVDIQELWNVSPKNHITTNQVLYNLSRRGPEYDLLPWCQEKNIPIMAYSPIEQGRILKNAALIELAQHLNTTAATLALAFVLSKSQLIAIPKSSTLEHIQQNRAAAELSLSDETLEKLDRLFPKPIRKMPLEVL